MPIAGLSDDDHGASNPTTTSRAAQLVPALLRRDGFTPESVITDVSTPDTWFVKISGSAVPTDQQGHSARSGLG